MDAYVAWDVTGGLGDDSISVKARVAGGVSGGAGDDVITLVGTEQASLLFNRGDGRDLVNISGETTLIFRDRSANSAVITRGEGTTTIGFTDSDDTVTIAYGGATLSGDEPSLEVSDMSAEDIRNSTNMDFEGWIYKRLGPNNEPTGFSIGVF